MISRAGSLSRTRESKVTRDFFVWVLGVQVVARETGTRSVLSGVTTHERGNDLYRGVTETDRANAPRWHASRDAPRHKWHRLRIQ